MHAPGDRRSGGGAAGDESSQLIDLRTLSRMAEAQPAAAGSAHRLAIPRFAASDLTRIPATPTPLLPPPSFVDLPLRRPVEDRAPLYALLASLTVAVAVLGAFVVLRPRPPRVVQRSAAPAAPSVVLADREHAADAKAAAATTSDDEGEDDDTAHGASPDAPAEATEPAAPSSSRGDRALPKRTRPRRSSERAPKPPRPEPAPEAAAKPPELSADCVLGLADCGRAPAPKRATPSPATTTTDRERLPAKLTTTQLRTGVSRQKPAAKQCGRTHGAASGEEVRVRLSIQGDTGAVVSAAAQGDHARDELGRCVASALAKASFPRFGDPAMGFLFTVRM